MATADLDIRAWYNHAPSSPYRDGNNVVSARAVSGIYPPSYLPSSTARIIYVDATLGNDSTGSATSLVSQPDPFQPDGSELPFKTISAGQALLREGMGDWLLLKRGETWSDVGRLSSFPNGASSVYPTFFGCYGSSGSRPFISSTLTGGVIVENTGISYITTYGIEIYNSYRDPNSVNFVSGNESSSVTGISILGTGTDITIDNLKISFFGVGIVIQDTNGGHNNVTLRNNIVHNCYMDNGVAHSQGIFIHGTGKLDIYDNFLYHNGWWENYGVLTGVHRTLYNHNAYLQYNGDGTQTTFSRNISLDASSHGVQQRMGGVNEDNFMARNAVGMNIAGENVPHPSNVNSLISKNVVIEGYLMDSLGTNPSTSLAVYGIGIPTFYDDNGAVCTIKNCIIANRVGDGTNIGINGVTEPSVTATNNIVHSWAIAEDATNPGWTDPSRTVDTYMVAKGLGATYQDFVDWHLSRGVDASHGLYSAPNINNYIREGFDLVLV